MTAVRRVWFLKADGPKSSGNTIALSAQTGTDYPQVGDRILIGAVYDNTGTSTPTISNVAVTGAGAIGSLDTKTATDAGSSAGSDVQIARVFATVTTAFTSATVITLTLSASVVAKGAGCLAIQNGVETILEDVRHNGTQSAAGGDVNILFGGRENSGSPTVSSGGTLVGSAFGTTGSTTTGNVQGAFFESTGSTTIVAGTTDCRLVVIFSTPSAAAEGSATGGVTQTGSATGAAPKTGASDAGSVVQTGSTAGSRPAGGAVNAVVNQTGSVAGSRTSNGAATGNVTQSATTAGSAPRGGTAAGNVTQTGSASGAKPVEGLVTGTVTATGSAAGERGSAGAVTGTVNQTGFASGGTTQSGVVNASVTVAGVVVGERTSSGSVSGSVSVTGAAQGGVVPAGTAAGSVSVTGSASGTRSPQGAVTGVVNQTGVANGAPTRNGTAAGSVNVAGSAAGARPSEGSATGQPIVTGSASGSVPTPTGSVMGQVNVAGFVSGGSDSAAIVTGSVVVSGTAAGTRTSSGSATGSATQTGAAAGSAPRGGSASGGANQSGSAVGSRPGAGTVNGTVLASGFASGGSDSAAIVAGSVVVTGSAIGAASLRGSVSGSVVVAGSASGSVLRSGSAGGSSGVSGAAVGSRPAGGSVNDDILVTGTAGGAVPLYGWVNGSVTVSGIALGPDIAHPPVPIIIRRPARPRGAQWRYLVQRLDGNGGGEFLDTELVLKGPAIKTAISGAGGLSGTVPKASLRAYASDGLPTLLPYSSAIWAEEGGTIRGGGIVTDVNPTSDSYQVECLGIAGYPNGLTYTGARYWVEADPLQIFRDIWAELQAAERGDMGITIDPLGSPVRIGEELEQVEFDTQSGPVSFEAGPFKMAWYMTNDIGKELDDLAKQTPFDWRLRSSWSENGLSLRHHIELGYPTLGVRRHDLRFVVGENVYAPPPTGNAGTEYADEIIVVGAGDGRAAKRGYAARGTDRRIRRPITIVDRDLASDAQANARAQMELENSLGDFDITSLTVRDHPNAPLGSWDNGDEILVDYDALDRTQEWCRVLSSTIKPESPGVVELALVRAEGSR